MAPRPRRAGATIVQGSLVVERALAEPAVVSRQMLLFRDYVRTVFTPELADPADCDCECGSEAETGVRLQ